MNCIPALEHRELHPQGWSRGEKLPASSVLQQRELNCILTSGTEEGIELHPQLWKRGEKLTASSAPEQRRKLNCISSPGAEGTASLGLEERRELNCVPMSRTQRTELHTQLWNTGNCIPALEQRGKITCIPRAGTERTELHPSTLSHPRGMLGTAAR